MERPVTEPVKLLEYWMEWETGETPPGRVMGNLKSGGMKELLEALVEVQQKQVNEGGSGDSPGEG